MGHGPVDWSVLWGCCLVAPAKQLVLLVVQVDLESIPAFEMEQALQKVATWTTVPLSFVGSRGPRSGGPHPLTVVGPGETGIPNICWRSVAFRSGCP
jgi:hypothetical protein